MAPAEPLSSFSPRVRDWFTAAFAAPTPAQALAWPAIARGEHVLLSAPTGSGKTLAAFLWALDRLGGEDRIDGVGTRIVYVSPLKALAYDIERNLRVPLRGIGGGREIRVGIRTGDTPQRERAAMLRRPPDILITTPESLYLLLTSRARETLRDVQAVIVDEIHAVAHSKRGAHLALTLERLQAGVQAQRPAATVQRIGLSATQRPLREIGSYLVGPRREVTILDAGEPPKLDVRIEVPVESMAEPDVAADPLEPVAGGESLRGSIWPAIYPELLRLVREHTSTIVFVNNRRSAERVALRLNELAQAQAMGRDGGQAPVEIARAHHGSLAREERTVVEELLKSGRLPCLVATSSLELGIDMGAVDLVLQIESPKSVARGLQRIGRAGHGVGEVSRGRIFPKFRGDLLECAVLVRRMREGLIEPTVVPRNALDVLAQQVVAIAVSAESGGVESGGVDAARGGAEAEAGVAGIPAGGHSGDGAAGDGASADGGVADGGVAVEELYALVTSTYSYAELSRELLENVLDMLDGRYASRELGGDLRPRIVWDRLAGVIRARRGARQLAIANAGTIPDRGLYAVVLPDGRRVGELDEEMVYEARPGQTFLLGASAWRIEEIGRDRVTVTPAPGAPGAVPFWKGDTVGRPRELGEALGAFSRWAVEQEPAALARDHDLDERAARNLIAYLREQQQATGVLPSDRTLVLERFRDEIGDWRLCLLSPYGGRVHAAWTLALRARIRERLGVEAEAIYCDDGIVVHLPELDMDLDVGLDGAGADGGGAGSAGAGETGPGADTAGDGWDALLELVAMDPDEVEEAIVSELGDSALFGARFREAAGRALLIPRAYPGRRTPLWQQRLKAQSLLEVARRHPDFPIVLETYRECLQDVLDVPGLQALLRGLQTREISLVQAQTATASPYASSLLFDYIATYMYEGDAPAGERRAAALSLDRDLLRELLGAEELRELIDPGALARVEDDLQRRSPLTRATGRDELHDVLRSLGDLTRAEVAERVLASADLDAERLLGELQRERRAIAVRVGGEQRYIAAEDAGLYRDALGVAPPAGLPEAFLADAPDALSQLVARYARTHGPFTGDQLRGRYRVDVSAVLRELECAPGSPARGTGARGGASARHATAAGATAGAATAGGAPVQAAGAQLVRGELRPGGAEREWCDVEVLRRLRRASLAVLRREVEPVARARLGAFMPSWQGIDRHASAGAGVERLREALVPLQGLALPVQAWERDVLPRRLGAYAPSWLDQLCTSGEVVWVGAGPLARSGRVALYFRDDAPLIGPPSIAKASAPQGAPHELLRARLAQGPCFFGELLVDIDAPAEELREALWDMVWAGEVSNDAWAPLRAPHLTLTRSAAQSQRGAGLTRRSSMRRFSARRGAAGAGAGAQVQGRWTLAAAIFAPPGAQQPSGPERRRALAELLLERYGVLTREQVLAERVPGGFAGLYDTLGKLETLGVCRRGYFIEGMGGAQFALPGAVERLRSLPERARPLVLAAADPAQPYGGALPWPRDERAGGARPARVAGAYVVLIEGEPVLYVERGGRSLITLAGHGGAHVPAGERDPAQAALGALAEAVRAGRIGRLALERIDGEPAVGSRWERILAELGFSSGPRRLTLSA